MMASRLSCDQEGDKLKCPYWGSRDGAVVKAFVSYQGWPRFRSQISHHKWVEFVVGSRFVPGFYSLGSPVFLTPQKPRLVNSNSIWKQ